MTRDDLFATLRARVRPVVVASPLGGQVGVRVLSGVRLDELDLALVKDARTAARGGGKIGPEAVAAERRLRVLAASLVDAASVEEGSKPVPRYALEELRTMAPEDRAKLEALVEAHGHFPQRPKPELEMPEANRRLLDELLVPTSGSAA